MEWIKVRSDIDRCGEVIRLSMAMNVSAHEAVGLCVSFWAWADRTTEDGRLDRYTPEAIDRVVGRAGFAAHLIDVGWLLQDSHGLIIPNFDRHMGESAKKRALNTERQRRRRREADGA